MSSTKRWNFTRVFTANGSCGCRKAIDIIQPKSTPKVSNKKSRICNSSAADRSIDGDCCNNSTTENYTAKIIRNSVAVVKISDDPYSDFRKSMIEMIVENELYSRDDLQQLLCCFLELNSSHHHELIVKSFTEIWNSTAARPGCIREMSS